MSAAVALIEALEAEGLSAEAIIRVLKGAEKKADRTNAERQARFRAKRKEGKRNARYSNAVTPPNDNILTPAVSSEAKASSQQHWACPAGVDAQVWTDFLQNRKRKRQGNTPTAWKSFNDDLTRVSLKTGIPPPKLIEHAAAKGWGGIYDPNERSQRNERPDNPLAIAVQRLSAHH